MTEVKIMIRNFDQKKKVVKTVAVLLQNDLCLYLTKI